MAAVAFDVTALVMSALPRLRVCLLPLIAARFLLGEPPVAGSRRMSVPRLVFPDWEAGKRVPHPRYTVHRASTRVVLRSEGLEPPRFYSLPPQGSASTNSATSAFPGSAPDLRPTRSRPDRDQIKTGSPAPM